MTALRAHCAFGTIWDDAVHSKDGIVAMDIVVDEKVWKDKFQFHLILYRRPVNWGLRICSKPYLLAVRGD